MSTRFHLVVRALLVSPFLLALPLQAQDAATTTVEAFAEIKKDYDAASKEWMDSYRLASKAGASKEEIAKMIAARPPGDALKARVQKVLEGSAANEDGASAAIWLIRVARVHGARFNRSLEVLLQHHLNSTQLNDVMLTLSRTPTPSVGMFLEKVMGNAESADTQARACHALAEHLKSKASMIRSLATANQESMQRYASSYGRETLDVLKKEDAVAAEALAAKRYRQVIDNEDYAAVDYFGKTLGEHCKSALFEVQNLSIGKVAPDIIGEDIDGTAMKLSDYRGKVVVIDFWGDW